MTTQGRDDAAQSDTSEAVTHLLGQRVKVMQPQKGYRIGMDGALLAAACAGAVAGRRNPLRGLELGCGAGGALLSLKARCPDLQLTGIEREPVYAGLARRNILLNSMDDVTIIEGDIGMGFKEVFAQSGASLPSPHPRGLAPAKVQLSPDMGGQRPDEGMVPDGLPIGVRDTNPSPQPSPLKWGEVAKRFDLVFSNPPFYDDPETLRPPHEAKRPAWIADDGLDAWLDFALAACKDDGDIIFIHRADRLADILSGLSRKAGSFMVRPVQPFADKDAKRVIIRARRLGKAPLRLLPPLILHDNGIRKHTDEVEVILAGDLTLNWT